MIKSENFMNELKDLVAKGDFGEYPYALEPNVSDGSSYDGFFNYTDGFVDCSASYTPRMYGCGQLSFKGFNAEQKKNAENAQLILDSIENSSYALESYWFDNIRNTDKDKWYNEKEFAKWYNDYIPHDGYWGQLDLFTGKEVFTETTNKADDDLFDDCQEYYDNWYNDSPAFIGVTFRLYDADNWRGKEGVKLCRLESYFNDDLGYGRESVGSWAGKSADGSPIGKHTIYEDEFEWNDLADLKEKLESRLPQAYESIGGEY